MLKSLKRWLGLERKPPRVPPVAAARRPKARPTNGAAAAAKGTHRSAAAKPGAKPGVKPGAKPAAKPGPKKPRRPVDVLDNPRLSLERPDEGFDPYNTGAFNRSQSWERIGKKKR